MSARRGPAEAAGTLGGKLVFVTGGGRGLGAAVAAELADWGARVAVADIDGDAARAAAASIGGDCFAIEVDIRDADAAAAALGSAARRHGSLHALVNNAGIDHTLPIEELTVEQWDAVIATNLRAPFVLARAAVPLLRQRGGGHIVNVASTAATRAWPNASAYHASKWGLLGLSRALHAELRLVGIKVSAVIAGGMRTPFLLERFPDIDPATLQDPANVARTVRHVLLQSDDTVIPEVMVLPLGETSWP